MDEGQACVIIGIQMPLEQLTRARIVEALNLLGELAEREDVTLELCVYGGTAMMLAYGKMNLHSTEQVEQQLERFYPRDALTPKARELIEGIFSEQKPK